MRLSLLIYLANTSEISPKYHLTFIHLAVLWAHHEFGEARDEPPVALVL